MSYGRGCSTKVELQSQIATHDDEATMALTENITLTYDWPSPSQFLQPTCFWKFLQPTCFCKFLQPTCFQKWGGEPV